MGIGALGGGALLCLFGGVQAIGSFRAMRPARIPSGRPQSSPVMT